MLPLDELNNLDLQVEDAIGLEALRPIYDRMAAIARENIDDFEVVLAVDRLRRHIVDRGLALRTQPPKTSPPVEPAVSMPAPSSEPQAAETPAPVVPPGDLRSAPTPESALPAAPSGDGFLNAPPVTVLPPPPPPFPVAAPPSPALPAAPPPPTALPPAAPSGNVFLNAPPVTVTPPPPTPVAPPPSPALPAAPPPPAALPPAAPSDDLFLNVPSVTVTPRPPTPVAPPPSPALPAAPPPPTALRPAAQRPATAIHRRRTVVIGGLLGAAAVLVVVVGVLVLSTRKGAVPPGPPEAARGTVPVDITTLPAGATVQINGEVRCKSNCRVDLAPGSYQVTALLDGFEVGATSVTVTPGKPAAVTLNLAAQMATVRLLSDLESGTVEMDGRPAGTLQDGQLALEHVNPGAHSVRVRGKNSEVSFSFEGENGKTPVITGPVAAKNMLAVLVASLGSQARLYSSSPRPLKVALNDQPQGEAGPQGLELTNFPMGDQNLTVNEGQNQHTLVVSFLPMPTVSAFLKSDVNTGTLVVSTGEDDVTVFLNGKEYRRKTKRGSLRVQMLGAAVVRVAKPGFRSESDQKVEIKKGEETKVVFQLKPLPRFAALQVHNGIPGTQIMLDDQTLGRVGPDGALAVANLASGEHAVEARREGFVARRIQRTLKAGETLVIEGAEIVLAVATGSVHLAMSPPEATVSYRRTDESQLRAARETTLKLEPGAYVFVARSPGFVEGTAQTTVAAGETRTVEITLAREKGEIAKPKPVVNWAGWSKEGEEYFRRGGNRVVMCSGPFVGTIVFTAHLRKAGGVFRGGKLRWFIEDGTGSTQFEVDKKRFQAKGPSGSISQEHARERTGADENTYTYQIDVLPDRIVHRMKAGDTWVTVDSRAGNWGANAKFGFVIPGNDEIGISDLRLTPK